MPENPVNLLKGDSTGIETDYRDYLPTNMSVVPREMFGAQGYMLECAGLTQYGTGSGIDRGGVWNDRAKKHFRVSGEDFIEVAADGTVTVLGTVDGSDTVSMPYSFNTQAIIANHQFYLYDPINGFRQNADPDIGAPIDSVWIDNVYFFTDGEYLYHTDFSSEETINAIKFDSSAIQPDPTLAVSRTTDNKVMVFNRYTVEYFQTRPADLEAPSLFGFGRVKGRLLDIGIVGTHCQCKMAGRHFIMGGRKEENVSIHAVQVGGSEKLGSREVDKVIGQYTEDEMSTSVLEARVEDDQSFLLVHLPNETLMLNVTLIPKVGIENAWTILKSGVFTTKLYGVRDYRAKHGVFEPRLGKWVYGDKEDDTLGVLDNEVATHYDELAEWVLNTPFMYLDKQSINKLDIETIAGHTVHDDAKVAISLTYDGLHHGKEYWMNYGAPTHFTKRFELRRLGYVANWVGIKLRGASKSRMAFARAFIDHSL